MRKFYPRCIWFSLPVAFIFLSIYGYAQSSPESKIDPAFQYLLNKTKSNARQTFPVRPVPATVVIEPVKPYAAAARGTTEEPRYQCIVYTPDGKALKDGGFIVNSILPKFCTAMLTLEEIERVAAIPQVVYIEAPQAAGLYNDVTVGGTGASLLHAGRLNNTAYKGAGVIVAIYDSGLDWDHPDFRNPTDQTKSRVLRMWDQTITAIGTETPPAGFSYGVEYTQAQINDELDGSPANFVRERDINGHGTHVAGTAAGNGAALPSRKYAGMAPEADIIIIKGGNGSFPATNTIDALSYLRGLATSLGRPIVLNMSIGGQFGPHDGTLPEEQAVDNFTSSGTGRVVVIAAGNDNGGNSHKRLVLSAGATDSVRFSIPSSTSGTDVFQFSTFGTSNETVSVSFSAPTGETITSTGSSASGTVVNSGFNAFITNAVYSSNGKRYVNAYVSRSGSNTANPTGTWTLRITNNSGSSMTFDGWISYRNASFPSTTIISGDNDNMVSSPGNATSAITTASSVGKLKWYSATVNGTYTYNAPEQQDNISLFSNMGPRRDGLQKPEITTFGGAVLSALSSDATSVDATVTGLYQRMQGTSMASPGVAGAAALLLQAQPGASAALIKSRITSSATSDVLTGAVPNARWGYGRLDVFKAMSSSLTGCAPADRRTYQYDNSMTASTDGAGITQGTGRIAVRFTTDINGKMGGIFFHPSASVADLVVAIHASAGNVPGTQLAMQAIPVTASGIAIGGFNYFDLSALNLSLTSGTDYFVVIYRSPSSTANWSARYDNSTTGNRSFVSTDGGATWTPNTYNWRIRPVVYSSNGPTGIATGSATNEQSVGSATQFINACRLITTITPAGSSPVSGSVVAAVAFDPSVQNAPNNLPAVQRRYTLTPAANPSSATSTIKLYFTQAELAAYNTAAPNALKLPINTADAEANKANVRLLQRRADSTSAVIDPADSNIVWNSAFSCWEITTDVTGLGAFYLQSPISCNLSVTNPKSDTACTGTTVRFGTKASGDGTFTYQWYKGATALINGTTANNSIISGATADTLSIANLSTADAASNYYVVVSAGLGCTDTSANALLAVNPSPSISSQPANTFVCSASRSTVALSVTATGSSLSYQWYKGSTLLTNGATGTGSTISGATTSTLTITNAGSADAASNYNVRISTGAGCTITSNNASITSNPSPNIFDEPDDVSICAGSQATFGVSLSISGNPTFRWFKGATQLTDGATGNGSSISGTGTNILRISNATPADNASNYYMIISSSNGCADTTRNTTLLVNPAPAKPTITASGPTSFCSANGRVTLSAPTGFSSYTWSNGATTQSITVTQSGSYNVTVSNGTCSSATSDAVSVTAIPSPNIFDEPDDVNICAGNRATFGVSLSISGNPTFRWFKGATQLTDGATGNGSSISGTGTNILRINDATPADNASNYYMIISSSNGCADTTRNTTLLVNPAPAKPTITVIGSTLLCNGGTVTLTAPAGFSTYQWSNNATTQSITVSQSGSYTVTVSNGSCSSPASDAVVVTAGTAPGITGQPADASICSASRSTVRFSVTASGNGTLGYRWYKGTTILADGPTGTGSTLSGTGTSTLTITNAGSADAATNYNVEVTSGGSCSVISRNAAIAVNPSPNIFDEPDDVTICAGNRATFGVSLSVSGNPTFRWYKGATQLADGATGNGSNITGTSTNILRINNATPADNASNYYMIISSSNGCSDTTRNTTLLVNTPPAKPVITANRPTTFCAGDSVVLSAPAGANSYKWSNGAVSQSITVTQSGQYAVTVSNTQGCSATSDTTIITVNEAPVKPVITVDGPTTFCQGASVSLSAPAGFAAYKWSNGATTPSITVTQSGNYAVVVTSSAGCSSPSSDTVVITVNPLPAKPVITISGPTIFNAGDSVILTAPAGFANYLWSNGATTRSIVVYTAGSYSVVVTNSNGCSSLASDPVVINLYSQPIVFVSVPGAGNGSGLNWANALPGNQISSKMLTFSSAAQFWVKAGTYYPTQWPDGCYNCTSERDNAYLLRNNVGLYGGFAGTESLLTQRNVSANPTTLSGDIGTPGSTLDNAYHVVLSVRSDSTAKLDGFTVTNGNASGYGYIYITVGGETFNQASGGGVFNSNANPVIANCTISNNISASSGGGMNNNTASPTIRNSIFTGNKSSYDGGAIHNASSSPAISYSRFISNTASSNGGAIANANAAPVITNCTFTGNSAYGGGGIYNNTSPVSIVNSIFANNSATYGGALHNLYSSGTTLTNSVFANNSASQGGSVFNNGSSPVITNSTFYAANPSGTGWSLYNANSGPVITNSVIWSNAGSGITGGDPTIRYSIVKGIASVDNNLDTDPLFVNAADPDGADNIFGTADDGLALQSCSPGINSGDNTANTQLTDVAGQSRIYGSTIDRGAYEYQGAATTPTMAVNGDVGTFVASPGSTTLLMLNCRVIGQVTSNGANPVSGLLTAKNWVDATQTVYPNGQTFLRRHFEVTPANGAGTATARITFYASQQEFNDFNLVSSSDVPSGPTDLVGKANLRIFKFSGTSSDGSGTPGSYPQLGIEINPDDNDIVWNNSQNRWEISFNVSGFSGFFIGNGGNNILPVTLLNFSGKALTNDAVVLNWHTAREVNTSYFELQRSRDGRSFTTVTQVAARGSNQSAADYSFTDKGLLPEVYYYRLRMVDKDGKESLSQVVAVTLGRMGSIVLFPVPTKEVLWLKTDNSLMGKKVQLLDVQGRVLQVLTIASNAQRIDVGQLAAGSYYIKTSTGTILSFVKE